MRNAILSLPVMLTACNGLENDIHSNDDYSTCFQDLDNHGATSWNALISMTGDGPEVIDNETLKVMFWVHTALDMKEYLMDDLRVVYQSDDGPVEHTSFVAKAPGGEYHGIIEVDLDLNVGGLTYDEEIRLGFTDELEEDCLNIVPLTEYDDYIDSPERYSAVRFILTPRDGDVQVETVWVDYLNGYMPLDTAE